MKQKLMLFAAVLLCIVMNTSITHSQPKIKIKLIQPPPDNLEANHLWKAEITNLMKDDLTIYLEGTAEESKDGMIVTGTTKQFVIKPGTRTYYYRDFEGGSVSWKNNKYKEILLRTGKAPSGTYTICMTAKLPDGSIAGMENCITHIVNEKLNQEIILIQPENGIELNPEEPIVFTWRAPIGAREPCCPFIKIVEITGNQSPEAAIKNNPAFYSNDNLRTSSFSYPVSAPKFVEGKKYAWQIKLNEISSDVREYKIKKNKTPGCDNLNIEIVQDLKNEIGCCFDLTIKNINNLPAAVGFIKGTLSEGAYFSEINCDLQSWDYTPKQFNNSNTIYWNKTKDNVVEKNSFSRICINSKKDKSIYLIYEWFTKDKKAICKDSILLSCKSGESQNDTVCKKDLVENGGFVKESIQGIMPTGKSQKWQLAYGSPSVFIDDNEGCLDMGYVGLSGNKLSGQGIFQTLNPSEKIIMGRKYKVSVGLKYVSANSNVDYVKIRVFAFNNILPTSTNHPGPNSDLAVIGISAKVKECSGWTIYNFPMWIANKDFDNIAINVQNNETSLISYAFVDNFSLCETDEDFQCNEIQIDNNGNPIIPPNLAPYLDNSCANETEEVQEINGNVIDLYGQYGADGTDTWYQNYNDPCSSIGGSLPDLVNKFNCKDSLNKYGIPFDCDELQKLLQKKLDLVDSKFVPIPIPQLSPKVDCDSNLKFTLNPRLPFSGRDIIFVHGLKLDHLCDKADGVAGANKKWPDDQDEFYNGYFKNGAVETWEDHIWNFLRKRNNSNLPTNRYLIVDYNCNQRLDVGVHSVLSQIREAMESGKGVEPNGDRRGKDCFGKDYVIISHSTGGLLTDVMLSIAKKTTTDPSYTNKWGDLSFIYSGLKSHIALQAAFSGSLLAKIFVESQLSSLTSKAAYYLMKGKCQTSDKWITPDIVLNSVLMDLVPEYTQEKWGPFMNTVPVDVLTIAGAQELKFDNGIGFILNYIHSGLNDGVLTLDCQSGNSTPYILTPNWFTTANPVGVFDLGIEVERASRFYIDQRVLPLTFVGSSIPWISPTGMLMPVLTFTPTYLFRFKNHYSFVQSTSDHFHGPRGNSLDKPDPFVISDAQNTTGYVQPCFDYLRTGVGRNWEETRIVTSKHIYTSGLVNSTFKNLVYEEQRGLKIAFPFKFKIPRLKNWKLVWITKTFEFWIWKRKYHLLQGSNCGKTECDYVYEYVLR